MISISSAKMAAIASIGAILLITVLEFPPPIGFETRPQSDVSSFWLVFFVAILIVEITAIPTIYKRPKVGGVLGILAATLNILQVLADQNHLMQPEVAPFGYSVLEGMVVIASLTLAYFSWKVLQSGQKPALLSKKVNSIQT
jgi:hypothetical protein